MLSTLQVSADNSVHRNQVDLFAHTLKQSFSVEGIGIHTGQHCKVSVNPAPEGHGLVFFQQGQAIPALWSSVLRCQRSTVLGLDGAEVSTVEHLLAALVGLGVWNARVVVEGPEIPILDGSAGPFCHLIEQAGLQRQSQLLEPIVIDLPLWVGQGSGSNACGVLALPWPDWVLEYELHYAHPVIGHHRVTYRPLTDDFVAQLSSAATFALIEEVQPLIDKGLALGGSLDNALVAFPDRWSRQFRVDSEPARHKCMDLLGDLALVGRPIKGKIIAVRAGHRWHVEMAKAIATEVSGG